ncbi:hypothetical protein ACOCJ7_18375 [Knoellia sp. CPCC 206453]|uniref:hypothetical protein n=1 Tax=Knoellia pratensis TaxID=3404796 RepID=UPI003605AE0A
MSFEVALQALGDDAAVWDDVSSTLSTATTSASSLTLSTSQLSWAADVVGLTTTYESMRAKIERLLREGTTETDTIAANLRTVKTTYEGHDEAAKQRLAAAWSPKS